MDNLFDVIPDFGKDTSKPDGTQITTTLLLFYSQQELDEFKQLCKRGIRKEYPLTYLEEGNVSDFLLLLLKRLYGDAG
jgi:hypothetical protein